MKQVTANQEKKSQVRSVLLLTDGLANRGVTAPAYIIEKVKKLQKENFPSLSTLRKRRLTTRTLQKESTGISCLPVIPLPEMPSQSKSVRWKCGSQTLMSPQKQPLEEATTSALPSTNNVSTLASMVHVNHDVTEEVDDPLHTKSSLKMVTA